MSELDLLQHAVVEAVRQGPGETDLARREALMHRGGGLPAPVEPVLATLADGVRDEPAEVDLDVVLDAGYSEDAVFEMVLCAAVGASAHRIARARAAVEEAGS